MRMRTAALWSVLAIVVLLSVPYGLRAQGTRTVDNTPVLFELTPDTTYAPYYVAIDKGFLKAEGVNASYAQGQGADPTLATMTGAAQFGVNSELPTLINKAKGGKFLCTANTLYAAKQIDAGAIASINKPEDLYGHKIGIPLGTGAEYFFDLYVAHHNLDVKKMTVLNVDGADILPVFHRGDIDAFFAWEPWTSKAPTVRPGAHLFSYSGADNIYVMQYCLNTNAEFAKAHPELVQAVLRGLIKATAWMKTHQDEAVAIVSRDIHLPPDQTAHWMSVMSYPVEMTKINYDDFVSVAKWMKERGKLPADVDPDTLVRGLFDPAPLKSVASNAVNVSF